MSTLPDRLAGKRPRRAETGPEIAAQLAHVVARKHEQQRDAQADDKRDAERHSQRNSVYRKLYNQQEKQYPHDDQVGHFRSRALALLAQPGAIAREQPDQQVEADADGRHQNGIGQPGHIAIHLSRDIPVRRHPLRHKRVRHQRDQYL